MLKILLVFVLLTGSFASFAEAELQGTLPDVKRADTIDEYKFHMGLAAGVSSPEGSQDATPEFGVDVGFQPVIPFGFGLEGSTTELDNGANTQRTNLFARATYNFGGEVPVLRSSYLGVAAGPTFLENANTEWTVAPLIGFDIPLAKKAHDVITLGLNGKYAFISNTPDAVIATAAVKYWY